MKLTTKGRYAVTAMLDIALHQADGPVNLADIAKRQGISQSYLEQLFTRLRRQGLVASVRGPGGGYQIQRPLAEITVAEIITAINESVDATRCAGAENCQQGARCLTHDLWNSLTEVMFQFLNQVSLAQLVSKPQSFTVDLKHLKSYQGEAG